MTHPTAAVLGRRLLNHGLAGPQPNDASDVVARMVAVQAQDFPAARWALGLRARSVTDDCVLDAYNRGAILRTHVLRPTWHFVTPSDLRWLLALTGPRVLAGMRSRHRQLELDDRTWLRARRAIEHALEREDSLSRAELKATLERAGVRVTPERVGHILMWAELNAVICSGAMRDGHLTYTAVDSRGPRGPALHREEALARLAARYYSSRGPASIADFAWWSGLSTSEAAAGTELAGAQKAAIAGTTRLYWAAGSLDGGGSGRRSPSAWLLPNYDEYLVAYRHRGEVLGERVPNRRDALTHTVIVNGVAVASWRRTLRGSSVVVTVTPRRPLEDGEVDLIRRASRKYAAFLRRSVLLEIQGRSTAAAFRRRP